MGPRHLKHALLLFLCAAAHAQFSQLGVSDDGSQVYFATGLRLPSEGSQNLPDTAAIYRIVNGVIERLTVPPGISPLPYHANADGNPQVSADGRVFVYTEYSNCYGGSACITYPPSSTSFLTIDGKPYGQTLRGEAQISRNGRFELNALRLAYFGRVDQTVELRDLQAGTTVQPPAMPAFHRQALTADGRILTLDSQTHSLALWSPQSAVVLKPAEQPQSAFVNETGAWVVYLSQASNLRSFEIATGRDILLAAAASSPSIGADGATVLYLSGRPAQVFLIHPDATARRQLTTLPDGVDEAVLSGNGRTAIAATGGRLVSIDVATAAVQELLPATPVCYPGGLPVVPGSMSALSGSALGTGPLRMDGVSVPVIDASQEAILFQVPWEAQPGATVTMSLPSASPFNGCAALQLTVQARSPYLFSNNSGDLILAHQDFSGLVTTASPAQPGEVVAAYAVGLGSVTPPIATGTATPIGQLYPLNWPFACYQGIAADNGPVLDVTFAGLAPTMTGIYQVNIRMPDPLPSGSRMNINCGTPGNIYERGFGIVPIAAPSLPHAPG
jgi:uncharacterized protein (TIGR03437 family)